MRLPAQSKNLSRPRNPVFKTNGGTRSGSAVCDSGRLQAVSFPSPWQTERTRRVHRICGCIERRLARGQTLEQSVAYFVWYHAHSVYHCDPARPFRLSRKTLVRLFYQWKKGGRTPQAIALHYRPARAKLSQPKLSRFVQSCLASGTGSYRAAFTRLKKPAATVSAYQKALPRSARAALTELFAAERAIGATRLAALKNTASATLSLPGVQKRTPRAFKAVLKRSQQKVKPALETHHAR